MKQTIIILEGPDRVGKSHIVKELSKQLGIPAFKAKNEHHAFLRDKKQFMNHLLYADPRMIDFLGQTGHSVIFDRAYPSEYAYSRMFKRETDMNMLARVDESFANLNTWLIVCHRSSYVGIKDDLDPNMDEKVLTGIDAEYQSFMKWTTCKNKMMLNVDDEDLKREIKDIMFVLGHGQYKKK